MKKEEMECCEDKKVYVHKHYNGGAGGLSALYGLGIFGAIYYFLQHAVGFWPVVLGILKGFFWPAFVVFKVLELLKL